jgi:hypothetical protein
MIKKRAKALKKGGMAVREKYVRLRPVELPHTLETAVCKAGSRLGRFGRLVIRHPGWTGNESISRNPSRVPILDSCTAHGAFKAADLARLNHVLAAIIDRAAFTGSMTRRF